MSIIENSQCLADTRCFQGLGIFLFQNKSTISGFVPLYRQLILCRFLEFLGIHYHQFECHQKAETEKPISLNYFTDHIKKVIYVFHGNWDSFDMTVSMAVI